MRISANDIKIGNILDYEGDLWMVAKQPEHTKPGKGGAYVQVEMKNLRTGNKLNQRFSSTESVQKAFLEYKTMQYLYKEDNHLIFMDSDTFEQVMVPQEVAKDKIPFMEEGMNVDVEFYQDKPLNIILAQTVVLEIAETDPVIKGSTVTSSYKPAIMVNGLRVMVPPYLVTGEKIIVRTEDCTFVKRAE